MFIVTFDIPEKLDGAVRKELATLAKDKGEKAAIGMVHLNPHSDNPEKIAKEIVRAKEFIEMLFSDDDE